MRLNFDNHYRRHGWKRKVVQNYIKTQERVMTEIVKPMAY
jgi:hypothetical protein